MSFGLAFSGEFIFAESVGALRQLLQEVAPWVWREAEPGRLLHAGQREVFFDDTQLELNGKQFESAAINYNVHLALSWQTLWVRPLLCDSHLGRPGGGKRPTVASAGAQSDFVAGAPAHFTRTAGAARGGISIPLPPKAGVTRLATTSGRALWSARRAGELAVGADPAGRGTARLLPPST